MRFPINETEDGVAPTITADLGHVSAYHIILSRIDSRFNIIGVAEIYEIPD